MRVLLDACVLYPTLLRQILIGAAGQGLFGPLWSDPILNEWRHASARGGGLAEAQARAEIALLRSDWPGALVQVGKIDPAGLPDPGDEHVLAAALGGKADLIVTLNLSDFPPRLLAARGMRALDPDRFLNGFLPDHAAGLQSLAQALRAQILLASPGAEVPALSRLLKRAGLPRLAKALTTEA